MIMNKIVEVLVLIICGIALGAVCIHKGYLILGCIIIFAEGVLAGAALMKIFNKQP